MAHLELLNQDHEPMHVRFLPVVSCLCYTFQFPYAEHHVILRNAIHAPRVHSLRLLSFHEALLELIQNLEPSSNHRVFLIH